MPIEGTPKIKNDVDVAEKELKEQGIEIPEVESTMEEIEVIENAAENEGGNEGDLKDLGLAA